jgi:hypothetical protein
MRSQTVPLCLFATASRCPVRQYLGQGAVYVVIRVTGTILSPVKGIQCTLSLQAEHRRPIDGLRELKLVSNQPSIPANGGETFPSSYTASRVKAKGRFLA